MGGYTAELAEYVVPARKGDVYVVTLDTTARAYSLLKLLFGRTRTPATDTLNVDRVYLRLRAITANVHYYFAPNNTVTLDRTATLAAGGDLDDIAAATVATYGDVIPAGTYEDVCISRDVDQWIHVQGSAAGTLIIRASSMPSPGDW